MKHIKKFNVEISARVPEEASYSREEVRELIKKMNKDLRLLALDRILPWLDENL